MSDAPSVIEIAAAIITVVGGSYIFFQNYSYWRKYGGNPSVYWFIAGGCAVFYGCWVIITRFLLPAFFPLDSNVVDLLGLSRRVLFVVVFLYFLSVGFWEYVLNK